MISGNFIHCPRLIISSRSLAMRLARSMTESVVGRLVGTVAAVVQCELFLKRVLELVIHCSSGVLARLALLGSKVLSNGVR